MFRIVLGVAAGVVLAICTILILELIGQGLFPSPPGLDPHSLADLRTGLAEAPPAALAFVVFGWVTGAVFGGWVANLVARRRWPALAVGGVVAAACMANSLVTPQPLWMNLAGVLAPLLAAALVARAIVTRRPA